jgi:transcriptional regulator with XRE-family HTH domain
MATQMRIPQWTVGDRLRKAREDADLGVEEIAVLMGRNRNTVTRYERARTADLLVVRAYSMLTNTPMEWLLTGHGPDDGNGEGVTAPVTLREQRDNTVFLKLVA